MMNLTEANVGEDYIVKDIVSDDEELKSFLFSLGCYSGEPVTVVSRKKNGYVLSIKDARYNIDSDLASAIKIWTNVQINYWIKNESLDSIFYDI